MFEIVNSPLHDHGRQPQLETTEPAVERLLTRVLEETRPHAVHVQELAGLPSSVLDVIHAADIASVVTLQDYFPLCSTFKLIDADGNVCLRREIGADCVRSAAADPRPAGLMIQATVEHDLREVPLLRGRLRPWVAPVARAIGHAEAARRARREPSPAASPRAFQRRREVNVQRLSQADSVIAMSQRVAEIYARMGVDPARLETVQLTLGHIERLRPRLLESGRPLTFATLAGFESAAKGGVMLVDALRRLSCSLPAGSFRLLVFGRIEERFATVAEHLGGIDLRGPYLTKDLDAMLDEVHVGIMPSVWEEAYGYAGIEFLAKGIPVIANAIGGMTDYVRDGETGWLNRSRSSRELARVMADLVGRPEQVDALNANLVASRHQIVKTIAQHTDEMDVIYRRAIRTRENASR
jgi:glycosyltransferase involved in cell wall biosynthesis